MSSSEARSSSETADALLREARAAQKNAYCPYSGCRVGAAVKARNDSRIFAGANVENASYGATLCAERNAISALISALGRQELEAIVIVSDAERPWPPCGLCLQVMAEFGSDDLPVSLAGPQGIVETLSLSRLLGRPFRGDAPGLLR